jgi:hypothetical protein
MPVVRCSAAASGTVTQPVVPPNDSAPPYRPAVDQDAPVSVPVLPPPEASPTVDPVPSFRPYAATSPDGPAFATVTATGVDVRRLPEESRARAVSVWLPLPIRFVFQDAVYGAAVISLPIATPSRKSCTPATATSSDALAVTPTVPDTVAPAAGATTATDGAVVSAVAVATASGVGGPMLPAPSTAATR